jgi:hypothetical protein
MEVSLVLLTRPWQDAASHASRWPRPPALIRASNGREGSVMTVDCRHRAQTAATARARVALLAADSLRTSLSGI